MKSICRLLSILTLALLTTAPVFAMVEAGTTTTTKPLSFLEFSKLPSNYGFHGRVLEWKYNEYRKGRLPISTLDISRMR